MNAKVKNTIIVGIGWHDFRSSINIPNYIWPLSLKQMLAIGADHFSSRIGCLLLSPTISQETINETTIAIVPAELIHNAQPTQGFSSLFLGFHYAI